MLPPRTRRFSGILLIISPRKVHSVRSTAALTCLNGARASKDHVDWDLPCHLGTLDPMPLWTLISDSLDWLEPTMSTDDEEDGGWCT